MGQGLSTTLSEEKLKEYQEYTYFTRNEIIRVHNRFVELVADKDEFLDREKILSMPELENNPFGERICAVFSEDGEGHMTFEDFLDMFSVFSENAEFEVKISHWFRILDVDNDGYLDKSDLMSLLSLITFNELDEEETEVITEKVLEECDLDSDLRLSFIEFEHVIKRSPDFINTFRIRI
eukprot:Nk52_evm13s967 gene=Nk52_evmTU13s967